MPITEALKKLIKTITGKNAVGETIEELVTNLNDNYPEGGGGGVTYETVAELSIGQMESRSGGYIYVIDNIEAPDLDAAATYYLNAPDMPSNIVIKEEDSLIIMFNTTEPEHPTPVDPNKPVAGVSWEEHQFAFYSSEDRFSNTTVTILKKVSGGSSGSGVKMIHATAVLPETEGGDITLDIDETDEECRAMVTSGEPVVIEVMAPVAELGTSLPIYGLMTSFYAPTENLWSATFCIIVDYNRTSIQAFVATLGSSDGGKRGMVTERNYDFSPKVVKVDFSVDYENKVLLSASHTPAEVVALVEGGTWVYGYDTTKGLYILMKIDKTEDPKDSNDVKVRFCFDGSTEEYIEATSEQAWKYGYK